jgi:retron-type reverse transcriptase
MKAPSSASESDATLQKETGSPRVASLGLPSLRNMRDLQAQLRLSPVLLYRMCFKAAHYYRETHIPKKSGGLRRIYQPSRELKAVQGWILQRILDKTQTSDACRGFQRGQSTRSNAIPHLGCRAVLTLDIENFFESISAKRVFGIFVNIGYSRKVATILTNLTTVHGFLPQGAPTSPRLSNLVCYHLDRRMMGLTGGRGVVYTRYADDLSFSAATPDRLKQIHRFVQKIILDEGFVLNADKTRFVGSGRRRQITGLVVRDDGVGLPRETIRTIRARLANLAYLQLGSDGTQELMASTRGWLAYVKSADPVRYENLFEFAQKRLKKRSLHSSALNDILSAPASS